MNASSTRGLCKGPYGTHRFNLHVPTAPGWNDFSFRVCEDCEIIGSPATDPTFPDVNDPIYAGRSDLGRGVIDPEAILRVEKKTELLHLDRKVDGLALKLDAMKRCFEQAEALFYKQNFGVAASVDANDSRPGPKEAASLWWRKQHGKWGFFVEVNGEFQLLDQVNVERRVIAAKKIAHLYTACQTANKSMEKAADHALTELRDFIAGKM